MIPKSSPFFITYYGILLILAFCCTTSNAQSSKDSSVDMRIKEAARSIMLNSRHVGFTTIDHKGYPRTRTMDPFPPDTNFVVVLGTNPNSEKVREIRRTPFVSLYYYDPESPGYVLLQGRASFIDNSAEKELYWKNGWENFYKNRTTEYALIKILPYRIEVVDYRTNLLGDSLTWKAPEIFFGRKQRK